MNILPELLPALNDLQDSFSGRFTAVNAPRPNEVYFDAPMELVASFCAQLYRKWNARLVSLFADDPRPAVDAFTCITCSRSTARTGSSCCACRWRPTSPSSPRSPMPSTPSTGRSGKCRTCLA